MSQIKFLKFFEPFELLYLRAKIKLYHLREERRVRALFYHDPLFARLDQAFLKTTNPYKIPKAFPYGETPLTTFKQIADRFKITKDDSLLELGCGRGRGAFFLTFYTGARVKGIDWVPSFIAQAKSITQGQDHLSFECRDFFSTDFRGTSVIYLYGTCLEDFFLEKLGQKIRKTSFEGKIITVSAPFPGGRVKDQFIGSFPWGKAEIFLNRPPE